MNVEVKHSIEQDMSVIKFNSLKDYRRTLDFLYKNALSWTPLTYSSIQNTASIRVDEHVLNIITNKFGVGKCQS